MMNTSNSTKNEIKIVRIIVVVFLPSSEDDQVYEEDDEYQNLVESMKSLLEARGIY